MDPSFLRCRLKTVLENPKYSMEQLKLATLSQTDQTSSPKDNDLSISPNNESKQNLNNQENSICSSHSELTNELQTMKKQITQLQKQIKILMVSNSNSDSPKKIATNNHPIFFKIATTVRTN